MKLGICYSNKIEHWPSSINELILSATNRNINVINNFPLVSIITFELIEVKIDNLPISLETLHILREQYKHYIGKIPFGNAILYNLVYFCIILIIYVIKNIK